MSFVCKVLLRQLPCRLPPKVLIVVMTHKKLDIKSCIYFVSGRLKGVGFFFFFLVLNMASMIHVFNIFVSCNTINPHHVFEFTQSMMHTLYDIRSFCHCG